MEHIYKCCVLFVLWCELLWLNEKYPHIWFAQHQQKSMMFTILRMEYITNFQFSTESFMHFVSTKHIHIIQTVRNKASGNSQSIAMVQQNRQQKMHTEFERWMMLILPSFSHCVASSLSLSRFLWSVFLIRWQCNTRAKISFLNEQRRNVTYFVYNWTMNML